MLVHILDTSAWARRDVPAVARLLREVAQDPANELVLSPAVMLELLRGPQGEAVAAERRRLAESFRVLPIDDETFGLAADAMEQLAIAGAEAHRLPITDLVTSALAHQHDACVLHFDGDYEAIAEHSGLRFTTRRVCRPQDLPAVGEHPVAGAQRALKREHAQLLHQLPVDEAEAVLRDAVDDLKRRTARRR